VLEVNRGCFNERHTSSDKCNNNNISKEIRCEITKTVGNQLGILFQID
jgi:hypothetical protein